uniref:Uncharacterized protein n=2 Tax=Parascaris TaxID=6254 RepID=A0A915BNP7_PARUN
MRLLIVAFLALFVTLMQTVTAAIPPLTSEGIRVKRYWGGGMGGIGGGIRPPGGIGGIGGGIRPPGGIGGIGGGIGGIGGGIRPPGGIGGIGGGIRPPGGIGGIGGGIQPRTSNSD